MNVRSILKGSGLVTASAALIALVTLVGILVFTFYNISDRDGSASIREISAALTWDGTAYSFSGEDLLDDGHWAMLVNEDGQVVWSIRKPADVPEQYSLTDVASFTRWYLSDYPVQSWVRDDGLLVAGAPKGSIWKHDMAMDIETLMQIPLWFGGIFLLALGCVLLLAYFVVRRWFRQAQQTRDAARSDWINGVSHDIRTPLSMVMGYAAQMEGAADLPPERRRQAGIIRAQSQAIRDLVNDLNLTMRLDCVLTNCVRHNAPGCSICLGARAEGKEVVIFVEGGTTISNPVQPDSARQLEPDGGAAHGTGLKLVSQIAAAHGGTVQFEQGDSQNLCVSIYLPIH